MRSRRCGRSSPRRRSGAPRVLLVEGEAGIGKTTLVERFLALAAQAARPARER